MATLEKIRSKSVLLVVIIAVALLAFILGDAITNGRNLFGNDTTVAKVGKEKVDYQEYQQHRQQVEEGRRIGHPAYAGIQDDQQVSQVALEELVSQKMLDSRVDKLGIKATPDLLRVYMLEENNPQNWLPEMYTFMMSMNNAGLPVQTPEQAYTVIFQPQTVGLTERQVEPFQKAWLALEAQYEAHIARDLYQQLLNKSFKANDLDVAAMRHNYAARANVKVARKGYDPAEAEKIAVNDADLKKVYEDQKERYMLTEPAKEISYIEVSVNVSQKDIQESQALAEMVVAQLKKNEVSKDVKKKVNLQDFATVPSKVNDFSLRTFLENAAVDSVAILNNNDRGFTVAKLTKRVDEVDSVRMASILLPDNQKVIDQVLAYANGRTDLDSIKQQAFGDSILNFDSRWFDFYAGENSVQKNLGLEKAQYDSLYNANGKFIELQKANGQVVYGAIIEKGNVKSVTDYELAKYELHPSDATIEEVREKLQKFITDNNTAEKFDKNAEAAGYRLQEMVMTASTPALPNGRSFYPDSRAVVRWAMVDGKPGEVSKIYQNRDISNPRFYVAAVDGEYKDYLPYDSKVVKNELTARVRANKLGGDMAKKYVKGTVEESAQAMEVSPREIPAMSVRGDGMVNDAKVRGRIMGSKASNKVQSVAGNDALYVFVVNSVSEEPEMMTDEQVAQMVMRMYMQDPSAILRGKSKVDNRIYKFEQAE